MTQVVISGDGHQVTVDHQGADLVYVIEKAQKLWDETRPPPLERFTAGFATTQVGSAATRNGYVGPRSRDGGA